MSARCPDCDASGYVTCSACGGDCEDDDGVACVSCEGRGDFDCERCRATGELADDDLEEDEQESDDE